MTIFDLLAVLVFLMLLGWALSLLPGDPTMHTLIRAIIIIVAVCYVLQWLGVIHVLPVVHVPVH
jgi:hypothetical protein